MQRVDYEFYAKRRKLPPVFSRIITGLQVLTLARIETGKVAMGVQELPPEFWNVKSKS